MKVLNYIMLLVLAQLAGVKGYSQPSPQPETISARYGAIYWGANLGPNMERDFKTPELYVYSQDEFQLLKSRSNQMEPVMRYQGDRQMPIYTRVMKADGAWGYQQISQVPLPDADTFILFIQPRAAGGFTFAAIDVSETAIPEGTIAFLNFTDKDAAAHIRGDQQRISALGSTLFKPHSSEKPDLPVKIAVLNGEWEQVFSSIVRTVPTHSYLMIFYLNNNREGAYRLRVFRDIKLLRNGD